MGRRILVFTKLTTLEVHDAWPVYPISCLPLPRLFQSVACSYRQTDAGGSHLLPRREPVLADMASVASGSEEPMAE